MFVLMVIVIERNTEWSPWTRYQSLKGWFWVVIIWWWLYRRRVKSSTMWCRFTCTDSIQRCPMWGEFYDRTYTILEGIQLCNSFAVLVSGTSLFIVIKYTRLKPRLIKNKFQQKRLILIGSLSHGITLVTPDYCYTTDSLIYVW